MKPSFTALALLAGLSLSGAAQATLIDQGATVYDNDLGISWLKNANLADTDSFGVSGINANGTMSWATAQSWIGAMNTANYLGYNDWRLPTTTDTGTSGCDFANSGTECGYNVDPASSEMAHLYFTELGNQSYYTASGADSGAYAGGSNPTSTLDNVGPFTNFQSSFYWSGTEYALSTSLAWRFSTLSGFQGYLDESISLYALAVRPGDVAAAVPGPGPAPVPEPATLMLLGLGLAGLGLMRRRRG